MALLSAAFTRLATGPSKRTTNATAIRYFIGISGRFIIYVKMYTSRESPDHSRRLTGTDGLELYLIHRATNSGPKPVDRASASTHESGAVVLVALRVSPPRARRWRRIFRRSRMPHNCPRRLPRAARARVNF